MAAIRKRGNSWQVQIRRQGFSPLAQSFPTHADAVAWARDKERSIDRSEILPNHHSLKAVTLRNHAHLTRADMIVVGAYVHSRLRETMLGGTTQSLLKNAPVPLFLSY